jgi:hypothetical protein
VTGCQRAVSDVAPSSAPARAVTGYTLTGRIDDPALDEVSGLALSRRDPGRLWALNDGGNPAELHLLEMDGRRVARYRLAGVRNVDWEDLAAFSWRGTPYLLVADIGDNFGRRDTVQLHLVEEPEVAAGAAPGVGELRPAASLRFRYPDGPRDAEGVAVDVRSGAILVLSKRETEPRFYRLPLRLESPAAPLVAEPLGRLRLERTRFDPPGGPLTRSLFGGSPTALDLDAAGRDLLLLTYTAVYRLQRQGEESWSQALERPFSWLADHPLPHAEALAVTADGQRVHFTSERLPAPLWRLDLAPRR